MASPAFDRLGRTNRHGIRQALRSMATSALPARLLQVRTRDSRPLFTFDDGPHPDHTPRILDTLATAGVKAEFYMIGAAAERHPDLVRRVADEGHLIGNHTWSHPDAGTLDGAAYLADVQRCRLLLEELSGHQVRRFRPPHGHLTMRSAIGLWRAGMQIVLWNVDPKDYAATAPDEILDFAGRA
ncbi:MAG TPA: polysaccharide deacetylase family protein, partial [Gemmatimonadales bacterium]|nr:polysaccharide deacetylase family protein [Gemmatimonadales bacterium]